MLFNSLTFVVFFALVVALHHAPLGWRTKKLNLLVASYLFYAAWNPPFVVLLWISTLVDWIAAGRLYGEWRSGRRRLWLTASVATNLGLLGFFKYGGFLLENFQALMNTVGVAYQPPEWNIVLPVGISFYTFQTMAYTLDVYLRRARPAGSFLDFALFVTFFPQLVAGPIVRPTDLIPQFLQPRVATAQQMTWGLALITLGLFNKIVVADGLLSKAADAVFKAGQTLHPLDAWLGTLAFSGQIFCDFAGYSTTAIGTALCLGFSLPDNFRFPYAAIGFSDFWRRWHISLSSWLRDYLYIPLGGSRKGDFRTYANLMTTMLLGGLWHGANWTFVVWGGLHGAYRALTRTIWAQGWKPLAEQPADARERILKARTEQLDRAVAAARTLRGRGVPVVFAQLPYAGHYAVAEPDIAPREATWDRLIERSGAIGLHFQDHPEMQGYHLPEWSHMTGSEADRFTAAFYGRVQRELAAHPVQGADS